MKYLNFDNINDIINKLGDTYLKENEETLNILKEIFNKYNIKDEYKPKTI